MVFYSCVQGMKQSVPPTFMLYLRLSYALQGTFRLKKMIFHEIFQVDSLIYENFSLHTYKT